MVFVLGYIMVSQGGWRRFNQCLGNHPHRLRDWLICSGCFTVLKARGPRFRGPLLGGFHMSLS